MEGFKGCGRLITISMMILAMSMMPVHGQISTPCTISMIASFTPCMNFITGSTANGSTPTSNCCGSLKSLLSTGSDCACLIITGNVPFQLPINRTLAITLPQACNMGAVPVQCKSSGSPLPAPGPVALGPILSPIGSPSSSRATSESASPAPAPAPEADTSLDLTPASPPVISETPASKPGLRPVLTPSAAIPSQIFSPSLLLFLTGAVVLKYH